MPMHAVRFITVFSIVFLFFADCGWSASDAPADRNLKTLQQRIQLIQDRLENLESKKNSVRNEYKENERKYQEVLSALSRLEQEISALEKRLEEVREERNLNENKIVQQKMSLARQLRVAHSMGHQDRLQLILHQQEPSRLQRVWNYFRYFNQARVEQLTTMSKIQAQLESSEHELLAGSDRLIALRKDKESEVKALEEATLVRKGLLAKLETEFRNQQNKLGQLKRDERRLQQLMRSVMKVARDVPFHPDSNRSFPQMRGRLQWPVDGKLVQEFGASTAAGRSNGVLIQAQAGEVVHSVADGRVIYADWLVRYGLLVIVDHGKGFMTLYAFNQSLTRSVGDTVKSGDAIATVGRSGGHTIPALYFEVRGSGKPLNPVKWFRQVRGGRAG